MVVFVRPANNGAYSDQLVYKQLQFQEKFRVLGVDRIPLRRAGGRYEF